MNILLLKLTHFIFPVLQKSPAKQIGHSLRKSFRCVPAKPNQKLPHFPETPEKTLDLSHIV